MSILERHPHARECGCCLNVAEMLEGLKLAERLDALHRLYTDLNGKADQIMAAQDDINAAQTQIVASVADINAAIAAGIGGGTPVDTSGLVSATSQLATATAALAAATPAPAAPAAEEAPPGNPFGG